MIPALLPGHYGSRFSLPDLVPADEFVQASETFSFPITGWSMFPTILKGDVLRIGPPEPLEISDLAVFRMEGALVCHRVMELLPGGEVRTRGDHTCSDGELVARAAVLGKVSGITRGGRSLDPARLPLPASISRLRMLLDGLRTRLKGRCLALADGVLAGLGRLGILRRIAQGLLRRQVTLAIGWPAPVRMLRAYQFKDLGSAPLSTDPFPSLPAPCREESDLILVARLGRIPLATLSLATGHLVIRRLATPLNLEELLCGARRQLDDWRRGLRLSP